MSQLTPALSAFLDTQLVGVLATRSTAGRVHQSLVYYVRDGQQILVSTERARYKARDITQTRWASLCVMGHERPFPSVTLAGAATVRAENIRGETAAIAQRVMGAAEPPEAQSDEMLASLERALIVLQIDRIGPTSYVDA